MLVNYLGSYIENHFDNPDNEFIHMEPKKEHFEPYDYNLFTNENNAKTLRKISSSFMGDMFNDIDKKKRRKENGKSYYSILCLQINKLILLSLNNNL